MVKKLVTFICFRICNKKIAQNNLSDTQVSTPPNLTSHSTPHHTAFTNLFLIWQLIKNELNCGKMSTKNNSNRYFYIFYSVRTTTLFLYHKQKNFKHFNYAVKVVIFFVNLQEIIC